MGVFFFFLLGPLRVFSLGMVLGWPGNCRVCAGAGTNP